jgi:hypothetical protein
MGDISPYSPEDRDAIVEHICDEIATKRRALTRICEEDEGMPSYSLIAKWRRNFPDIRERISHAREDALEAMVEEIVTISDERNHDPYIAYDNNGKPYAKIDGDAIQRAKLRVYARERAAALLAPRIFGAKLDVTSGGEKLPAPAAQSTDRLEAIMALIAHRRALAAPPGEVIDVTPEPGDDEPTTLDDVMR